MLQTINVQDRDTLSAIFSDGPSYSSNRDLLAVFVGEDAARAIMQRADNSLVELAKLSTFELAALPGMTKKRAATVAAVLELGRRRASSIPKDQAIITSSHDVAEFIKAALQDMSVEVFVVLFLNRANKVIHSHQISMGGITGTVADPRIILKLAVERNACGLILSHNHPSGSLRPSRADEEITNKLKSAAHYFDIKVLDHLIVSDCGYYSFADEGLL